MKKTIRLFMLCFVVALSVLNFTSCKKDSQPEDEITVEKLVEANDIKKIVKEYGNIYVKENIDYESGATYTTDTLITSDENGLACNTIIKSDETKSYFVSAVNGVEYLCYETDDGMYYSISILPDDFDCFANYYYDFSYDEITKAIEVNDGTISFSVNYSYNNNNSYSYSSEKTYYFNSETLLLESIHTNYDFESSGMATSDVDYTYNSKHVLSNTAYDMQKNAEDKVDFTIIRNGKTDNETRTECTISLSSEINIYNNDNNKYSLFENVSCTSELENVSEYLVTFDYPIIYLGETKKEAINFTYTYTQADAEEFNSLLNEFETIALDNKASLSSIQIAYDYMWDKYEYICAQANIAYIEYCKDTTSNVAWDNYSTVDKISLDSKSAIRAVFKRLYLAEVEFNNVLFKNWSQESIDSLICADKEKDDRLTELYLKRNEIVNQIDETNNDDTFVSEASKLYERFVLINIEIAKLNGYDNYYDYSCSNEYKRDWNKEEISNYCSYVKKYIVPLYDQIESKIYSLFNKLDFEERNKAWEYISSAKYSDFEMDYVSLYFDTFEGTLRNHFNAMFDKNTSIFINEENGKPIAYTNYLTYYGEPYCVFGSGNNYYQCLNTIVHEAGHYASFYNYSMDSICLDLAETHSQANELLFMIFLKNYLEKDIYEYYVLASMHEVLWSIIQFSIVNEFEMKVYDSSSTYTKEDYTKIVLDLCAEYNVKEMVIDAVIKYVLYVAIQSPVYYVSYSLAYIASIDLYIKATTDYKAAQECYRILQEDAAKVNGFKEALAFAGIGSPFNESTFKKIYEAFDFDTLNYNNAVIDSILAEENEIRDLVTLTKDDERVSWKDDKVLLITFHNYPSSYPESEIITTGDWYMWTVTDGEMIEWFIENEEQIMDISVAFKQLLGMPLSSSNGYVSAVWVNVDDIIRPAYQTDPTKQLTADDLTGNSLGEYEEWFNSNIISSYFSPWGQYPWTRLGYTYNWGSDDEYGLTEFLVLKNSTIEVKFTMDIYDFYGWLIDQVNENYA